MSSSLQRTGMLLGLVLVLWGGLSWGGGLPSTNDDSSGPNTGGGAGALVSNTTGRDNTAYGFIALVSNTTGSSNTAYGTRALNLNTTGIANTASGFNALGSNFTGPGNIAIGSQAGSNLEDGSANIYLGHPGEAIESNTMRLGEDQTRTFIAGVADVQINGGSSVVISPTGQLGVKRSSARYKHDIEPLGAH